MCNPSSLRLLASGKWKKRDWKLRGERAARKEVKKSRLWDTATSLQFCNWLLKSFWFCRPITGSINTNSEQSNLRFLFQKGSWIYRGGNSSPPHPKDAIFITARRAAKIPRQNFRSRKSLSFYILRGVKKSAQRDAWGQGEPESTELRPYGFHAYSMTSSDLSVFYLTSVGQI